VEANRPTPTGDQPGLDRRTFFRRTLCDARAEFAQLDGPIKIMEAGLLTTMGAIGLVNGFVGVIRLFICCQRTMASVTRARSPFSPTFGPARRALW